MFRLGTFGGLTVAGQDGTPIAIQRLRLALLALLAHAGERGLSREKLLGFLWAESHPDSARHKLDQALYMVRRQLAEALFIGTDPMRLNPEILSSDVTDFEHALGRGDLLEGVSLYQGPFLDGFYLSGAEEFERWVTSERDRLAERYQWALEQLATGSAARADPLVAVGWWRKLAAVDPFSARVTLGLMRALAAVGDRPAALRQAQIYDQLVRQELQSDPDPAIHSFAEELRTAPPLPIGVAGQRDNLTPPTNIAEPPPGTQTDSRLLPSRGRGARIAVALPTAVAAALFLVLALQRQQPGRLTNEPSVAHRIVIVPFEVASHDSSLTYLREGMVDLLAAKLTGEAGPVAVDPRTTLSAWRRAAANDGTGNQAPEVRLARAVGAAEILRGEIVQAGGGLVLNGTVLSAEDQRVEARATVSGSADSLLGLVDRLAASLLALQAGESAHRLALLTSTSLPALRAYLEGRAAYRHGEAGVAMTDYARALDLDSTFALAALELMASSGWVITWVADGYPYRMPMGSNAVVRYQLQWQRAMELAWRNRQRLSRRDFAILMALRGPHYPEGTRAREVLDRWWQLAQNAPDRADTWYVVGLILLYQGPALSFADSRDQASAAFHRALALDPEFGLPLAGLIELAAQRGDTAEVHRLGLEYLVRDSIGPTANYIRWHMAAVSGDSVRLQAIRARFDAVDLETLDRIQWTAQVEGIDVEDADRAMAALMRRLPGDSGYVLFAASMLALNRGRPHENLRIVGELQKLEGANGHDDASRLLDGAYWDGDPEAAAESARFLETHAGSVVSDPRTHWRLAQWWLARGDTARALRDCEVLQRDGIAWDEDAKQLQIPWLVSLVVASMRGQPNLPGLLARADSFTGDGCCNIAEQANLLVARAHERAGDLPGALAAVRRQRWFYPPQFLSTSLREEGRLAALSGDTADAVAAYRHYLALRSDPEPQLQPDTERIRRELARLEHSK